MADTPIIVSPQGGPDIFDPTADTVDIDPDVVRLWITVDRTVGTSTNADMRWRRRRHGFNRPGHHRSL